MSAPLLLIDGTTLVFRAYYALGDLTRSDGQPTQAVYGVINMLRSLLREHQPEHIAFVMDAPGGTFRHELYSDYKANRPSAPADLRWQIDKIKAVVQAMGIGLVCCPGVEADDVIATLAVRARDEGRDCLILSGDKDLMQLVDERIIVEDPMRKVRFDAEGVEKKYGVPPTQMIDYQCLVGDSTDNIPGIDKVGPKTAVNWLKQYGSLEEIVKHADDITGKVGENLRAGLDGLALTRQLVTLKTDLSLKLTPEDLRPGDTDPDALRTLFTELEFRKWLEAVDPGADEKSGDYALILDKKTLDTWLARIAKAETCALVLKTDSEDPQRAEPVGIGFAIGPDEAAYLPLAHQYLGAPKQLGFKAVCKSLAKLFAAAKPRFIAHEHKFALQVLARHECAPPAFAADVALMSYVLEAGQTGHTLSALARRHLDRDWQGEEAVTGRGKGRLSYAAVELAQAVRQAAEEAELIFRLHAVLAPKLTEHSRLTKLLNDLEMPLAAVLARMEDNGFKVDAALLGKQSLELAAKLEELEQAAYTSAGEAFNIASPKQIETLLFDKLELASGRKTSGGQRSTSEAVLSRLAAEHELPRLILEHRALAKLKNTYTDKLAELVLPDSGRIHTRFHQALVTTGRLSSSSPNLQNIPVRTAEGRRIREAFIAAPGFQLLAADYSQIELRIMAHLSEDAGLIAAFNAGQDIHRATAAEVFGIKPEKVDAEHRSRAKAINFGLIYGISAFGLARQLDIEQTQARDYMNTYFARYPQVHACMQRLQEEAREQGWVETILGRRMYLPQIKAANPVQRQAAERVAINMPMQGSAADLIKRAMLAVQQWIDDQKSGAKLILQVHDELLLEVPEQELKAVTKAVVQGMQGVAELSVPLVVDTGQGENWRAASAH